VRRFGLRIAARYADEWNHWGLPETAAQKGGVFRSHCERIGRDPANASAASTQALIEVIAPG